MEALFSYGTLQQAQVQLDTFGRYLEGERDVLLGYRIGEVKITDAAVIQSSGKDIHPILEFTGVDSDRVDGTVYLLTSEELAQADHYEVADYKRVSVLLLSKRRVWIYAKA